MILIVEDTPEQRIILSAIIDSSNLGPSRALVTAEEALAYLEADRRDGPASPVRAILMDVLLPGMDGISAAAQIHANPRLSGIPIIVISALEDSSRLTEALTAGAVDYLVKPVQPVQLAGRLRAALRQAGTPGIMQTVAAREVLDRLMGGTVGRGVLLHVAVRDWAELCRELGRAGAEEFRGRLIAAFAGLLPHAAQWLYQPAEGSDFSLLVESDGNTADFLALARSLAEEMPWPSLTIAVTGLPADPPPTGGVA